MKKSLICTLLFVCFTWVSGYAQLYINEVNPNGKWIEIYNSGPSAVDISGYMVARWNIGDPNSATSMIPSGVVVGSGKFVVLYRGPKNKGTDICPVDGAIDCLSFGISATKCMRIRLYEVDEDFEFISLNTFNIGVPVVRDQSWARATDGSSSIVALEPTPGWSNSVPPADSDLKDIIYINEINATGKWIELYNAGVNTVNLGGCVITRNNNDDAVSSLVIPAGTMIAGKSHLVLYRGSTAPPPVMGAIDCLNFGISAKKFDSVLLRDANRKVIDNTFFIGEVQTVEVARGQSWARVTDGAGTIVALDPTPGRPNDSQPLISNLKVYVNEVNPSGNWIELYNAEDTSINVSGYTIIRINDTAAGIAAIPAGTSIPAKGFLVLCQEVTSSETSSSSSSSTRSSSSIPGAIPCLSFGISSDKFESAMLKDPQDYIVDIFEVDAEDPNMKVSGGLSWSRIPDGATTIGVQSPSGGESNGATTAIVPKAEHSLIYVYAGILNLPENVSDIQLYGVSGNLVLSRNVTETSVDLTHLPKGFYLLRYTISGVSFIQKIVHP